MYDVFLSHRGDRKHFVRQLARQLRAASLTVFHDEDSVRPGEDPAAAASTAIGRSRQVVLVLSASPPEGEWRAIEAPAGRGGHEGKSTRKVILVILETVDTEPAFRGLETFDLAANSVEREYPRLLSRLGVRRQDLPPRSEWPANRKDPVDARREPRVVHELPPAPRFVGRAPEVEALRRFWASSSSRVLAVVGIGGAGKTALVKKFCSELLADNRAQPDGVLVWSFYQEADPGAFLECAYEYFTGQRRSGVKGAGWLHLLRDALSDGKRHLLVLDGLERVQREKSDRRATTEKRRFGQLEDPLLREFLKRVADGAGQAKAIITSRFPVVDLASCADSGYEHVGLGQLDRNSALLLLRSHGIRGSDAKLEQLTEKYGRHALTLDHLGSLLSKYFDGDPDHAPESGFPRDLEKDPQAHHLASVFRAYERCLEERELAVLSRLCVFRFAATVESFYDAFVRNVRKSVAGPLFRATPTAIRRSLEVLVGLHLVLQEGVRRFTVHPAVRDHFYHVFARPRDLHEAASKYFAGLAERPGGFLPRDKWTLDQLEELVFHLIAARRVVAAERVYRERLGGVRHLTDLGGFARGLRILSEFPKVIDPDGLLRFRRGVGDLPTEEEWQRYDGDLTWFSTHGKNNALLLSGRLRDCDLTAAAFLRGEDESCQFSHDFAPRFSAVLLSRQGSDDFERSYEETRYRDGSGFSYDYWELENDETFEQYFQQHLATLILEHGGEPRIFDELHAYCRRVALERYVDEYFEAVTVERTVPAVSGDSGDTAVCHLWTAEMCRVEGDLARSRSYLERASRWILHASSQEHLCLLQLVRTRLANDSGNYVKASSALAEGLDSARRCRFRIFQTDLLNEQARLHLLTNQPESAAESAREARELACAPECGYVWGEALAVHYLTASLFAQGRAREAKGLLRSERQTVARIPQSRVLSALKVDY